MKKLAFAALAAALAAPAFAQTVTLWGRLNTSVESQKTGSNDRVMVVANNSSRLGFKGTEDLGGGLKASFNLEHGFNSDTGTLQTFGSSATTFWSRQANVELSGDFGAVRLGTWFPDSYFTVVDPTSNHNHDTGSSSDALFSSFAFGARTNKVGYFTPTMGGLSAAVSVHAGENNAGDGRAYDLSANYTAGGLHIGVGAAGQRVLGSNPKNMGIEADYSFGPFLVTGYVQRERADGKGGRNIQRVSGMYTLGQSEFHVNYGHTSAGGLFGAYGADQYTFGYNYNLSKRTKVYTFYTAINNKAPGSVGDFNSFAAGVRHNF
jgi:predicted porin